MTRGLLAGIGEAVRAEIVWLLRWTIRLAILGALMVAVVRLWLVPAAEAWLAEQRAAITSVTPDLPSLDLPPLDGIRDHLTGGTR